MSNKTKGAMKPYKKQLREASLIEAAEVFSLSEILDAISKIYKEKGEYRDAKWSKKLAKIFRTQYLYK